MDIQNAVWNHGKSSDIEKKDPNADCSQECSSTCECSDTILTSITKSYIEPELHSEPPSCHNLDLCNKESDNVTSDHTTVLQVPLHNGEETSPENRNLEIVSSISTIINTQNAQASVNDNDLPSLKNTVIESVILESSFPVVENMDSLVVENIDSPVVETMGSSVIVNIDSPVVETMGSSVIENMDSPMVETTDSSINYNLGIHLPDSINCSDQHMSECGDSVLQPSSECHQFDKDHTDLINKCSNDNIEGKVQDSNVSKVNDDYSIFSVDVKQEPYDAGYERPDLVYRNGAIVVDSDDDTSSTMFSDNGVNDKGDDHTISDEEVVERLNKKKLTMAKNCIRTEGEVFPEELPTVEYLTISPDENVILEPLGVVSGVVGVLVIVKADLNSPALYDDTVLFLEGRKPLGLIFEIFGTVEQPYYSVRFNVSKDITERSITAGDRVFFAPRADNLTKYVFIAELKKIKSDDASWENDNPPPPSHVEFSDDEEERRARQLQRFKDRGTEDNQTVSSGRRKKRRKKPVSELGKDFQGPQLLQGDLNKNPFGNKDQLFSSSTTFRRPQSESNGNRGYRHSFPSQRPQFSPRSSPQPPPTSFNAYRKQWPSHAGFGESPGWNGQPGLLGELPKTSQMNGSPKVGSFGNGNMFSSQQFRPPQLPATKFVYQPFPSPPGCNSGPPQISQINNFGCGPPPCRNSGPPQISMTSHINNFGCRPYFSRPNMEHINTSTPPPSQIPHHNIRQPNCFPVFHPSLPPPVVSTIFTPPPHPRTPK